MSTLAQVPARAEPGARPDPVRRVLAWAPLVILAMVPVLVLDKVLRPIADPDTFWHIRAGEYLWGTWQFSGPDPWTSASTEPFVLHEWLAELPIAAVYHLGGFTALSWLQAALVCGLLAGLYVAARAGGVSDLGGAVIALAGWWGTSGGWGLRPQIVSFALLIVTVAAWLRTVDDGRPRWWLIPLTYLWACAHGLWVTAPLTGLVVVAGLALDRRLPWRRLLRLCAVPVGGLVAAALTPIGPALLLKPLTLQGYGSYVQEWQPTSIVEPATAFTIALAATVAAVWARDHRTASWAELALWATGIGWTLLYGRTVALGAVTLAVLAGRVTGRVLPRRGDEPGPRAAARLAAAGLAAAVALGVVATSGWTRAPGPLSPRLAASVSSLPAHTVVFNDYGLGGYLLFADHDLDTVIDGRADVYTLAYFRAYFRAVDVKDGWERTVRDSGASAAVLRRDSALALALRSRLDWVARQQDDDYVLLVAPSG